MRSAATSSPGPVVVTLHVAGPTAAPPTTVAAQPTPTAHTAPPHGFLPLTGAPAVFEGTAALALVLVGTLAVITARRRGVARPGGTP